LNCLHSCFVNCFVAQWCKCCCFVLQADFGTIDIPIVISVPVSVDRLSDPTTASDLRGSIAASLNLDPRTVVIRRIVSVTTGEVLVEFSLNSAVNTVDANTGSGSGSRRLLASEGRGLQQVTGGVRVETSVITSGVDQTKNSTQVQQLAQTIQTTSSSALLQSFVGTYTYRCD
jgi:hypothetical protein